MTLKNKLRTIGKQATVPFRWFISGVSNKTSWEWLELLIVPVVLAGGAFLFESQVEQRQAKQAEQRRAEQEELAEDQRQQAVLDNYFDDMKELLLERNLRSSTPDSEVRSVARAITTTTMRELGRERDSVLGGERNSVLVDFLRESNLLYEEQNSENSESITSISILTGLKLQRINLRSADLSNANLRSADLRSADLSLANLIAADLNLANLSDANLIAADLSDANLSSADLSNANLSSADLSNANLSNADLIAADLSNADLSNAEVGSALLFAADLRETTNLTPEQLTGDNRPYLCGVALPPNVTDIDPNRDCDNQNLIQTLINKYDYPLDVAQQIIETARNKQGTDSQ